MAIAHGVSEGRSWLTRAFTTDFCPWANRFVYWLKEPVGWFVLATLVSIIIGLYFAPIGWTMAASLLAAIVVGMIWPAVAVRSVTCVLEPSVSRVHEGDTCVLVLQVRNRCPFPVWGVAVENFLDRKISAESPNAVPTVALAVVRGWSTSTYEFSICPADRGRYPNQAPVVSCSFPFGIWTARAPLHSFLPITVWPRVYPITDRASLSGSQSAPSGLGRRTGRSGEFCGVRDYRRGDRMRDVNWVATARTGDLVVTERSGPELPTISVFVDAASDFLDEEVLSDRIRVAASLLAKMHCSGASIALHVGGTHLKVPQGKEGFAEMMDLLADIQLGGIDDSLAGDCTGGGSDSNLGGIKVSSDSEGDIVVDQSDPRKTLRRGKADSQQVVKRVHGIASQMLPFWSEVKDECLVA